MKAYEQAGAAAIQLEDQVLPKRCGHMEGKEVIPLEEAVAKIRAAVRARHSRDFLVIARTDARSIHGLDDALFRAEAFLESGADILFVEAPQSLEELRLIGERFKGVPLMANMVEDGKGRSLGTDELSSLARVSACDLSRQRAAGRDPRLRKSIYQRLLKGKDDTGIGSCLVSGTTMT